MQKQFTFTRTENLTEYQKLIYDMFEVWGHERFQLLTLLFQAVFTEEDMKRPEYVTSKLVELSHKGYASIRAAPETYDQPRLQQTPDRYRKHLLPQSQSRDHRTGLSTSAHQLLVTTKNRS